MLLSWGQKLYVEMPKDDDLIGCMLSCICPCNPARDNERGAWCTPADGGVHRIVGGLCRIDMVLVGAEGVVENGGVINKLGTYQAALSAHCHNTPFYVAAESYKASTCLSSMHSI